MPCSHSLLPDDAVIATTTVPLLRVVAAMPPQEQQEQPQQQRQRLPTRPSSPTLPAPTTLLFLLLVLTCHLVPTAALTKVVVPAVYKEYQGRFGQARFIWDDALIAAANYSIFMYQKFNASLPRYVPTNRGCEVMPAPHLCRPLRACLCVTSLFLACAVV